MKTTDREPLRCIFADAAGRDVFDCRTDRVSRGSASTLVKLLREQHGEITWRFEQISNDKENQCSQHSTDQDQTANQ